VSGVTVNWNWVSFWPKVSGKKYENEPLPAGTSVAAIAQHRFDPVTVTVVVCPATQVEGVMEVIIG